MNGVSVGCWSSLLLVFLHAGPASTHPVTWSPSGQEMQSLQDLLERLKEKFEQGERETLDLEVPDYGSDDAGAVSPFDLADSDNDPNAPSPFHQTEVINQWRKFLASPKRRRHFSGCFGTRLERIGTQTGLGCNIYKSRSRKKSRS